MPVLLIGTNLVLSSVFATICVIYHKRSQLSAITRYLSISVPDAAQFVITLESHPPIGTLPKPIQQVGCWHCCTVA
jgi:hypothetical protein